jgi:hypothetical protein
MSCNISKCGFGKKSSYRVKKSLRKRFGKKLSKKFRSKRFGSSDMSLFQSYTGMPPSQMQDHFDNIPMNLRSNFYTNLYGKKKNRNRNRFSRKLMKKLRKRRFGKMNPGLSHIMGNTQPNDMSAFQSYTGVAPGQMENHLQNVPLSIRDNFYTDL